MSRLKKRAVLERGGGAAAATWEGRSLNTTTPVVDVAVLQGRDAALRS